MNKCSRIISVCVILILLTLCVTLSPQATDQADIPAQTPHLRTDICPCSSCDGKPYNGVWTEITAATADGDFVNGGHYVLSGTVDLTGRQGTSGSYFNIVGTKELVILVEGTLTTATNDRALRVGLADSTSVKVWLLGNGGKITGTGRNNNMGTLIRVGAFGTLNIGGDLVIEPSADAVGGSSHKGVIDIVSGGTVNVNGGTIKGITDANNTASGTGGAFYNLGSLNINGGVIYGGNVKEGGAIYTTGSVNIGGGMVRGGTASNGGTVYMAAGTLDMTGGTVTGGTARNRGVDATDGHGGAFYLAAGSASFRGGTIDGGKTVRVKDADGKYQGGNGGSIYAACSFEIDGVTIKGGTCRNGGAVYITSGTLSLKSGQISGGSVYSGAAFYLASGGRLNMTDGSVTSGTITAQGALAFVDGGGILNMTGGTMLNTVSGESGIRVQASGKVYLHGNALIKAGSGARDAIDAVGTTSTPAALVLAGSARVGDLEGKQTNTHNISLQAHTNENGVTYYPRIYVANDWTGYATITDNFGSTASGKYICLVDTTHYAWCGTWNAETLKFTQGGVFASTNLIHGTADEGDLPIFGEDGCLQLPRSKAVIDGTNSWYRLSDQAVDAAVEGNGYAVLYKDDTNPITVAAGKTAYVDFNGCNATVTGEGTLKGLDSSALATGAGTTTVTLEGVTVEPITEKYDTGEIFVALKEGNTVTFHAVTANITAVNIRPSTVSMYYSAAFVCDEVLQNYLDSFGVAVSLARMPDQNFASSGSVRYTQIPGEELASGKYNSVLIKNIFEDDADAATNKARGERPIYANAYLKLTINGEEITVMGTTTAQFSLETMLQKINTHWDTFGETAQTALATNIYDPYLRQFEGDDWALYNLRIKANGGYTPEEKAILEERRQIVLDYMRQSVSMLWRSDKTLTYGLGNTERDNGASFTIVEGQLYKGLPYVYAAGTQDSFLEYAAGEPDENGIYTITGLEATALNYESYGGRVGNDCSGAVTNAWSQISTSVSASTSSGCCPYFGVVPVGNYNFNAPINPSNNRVLDTAVVTESNGEQVMYEAYAMLQPGDAAYHQEYPSTRGNHIRMVVSVNVVRNSDGTINGNSSTITMLEQTRTLINDGKTETHPVTGETIYVIGGVNTTHKFSTLFSQHYIPVTIKELRDPTPVEETWVEDSLEEEASIDNLFTGIISSNRYTDSVQITIYNDNGDIVQQSTGRKSRSYSKRYHMERFINEKPGSFKGNLDLDALEPGNYRCTVTLKLTIDSDYIHTVRDFTFRK